MNQLSIKLPQAEMDFLEWYNKKHATPKATLYRDVTLNAFKKWKHETLLTAYMKGEINFKEFCRLGNMSFLEGMIFVEDSEIEPVIPQIIDEYTQKVTDENILKKDLSIFKNKQPIKRETPPVDLPND
ncbi:MAG: hypothetical protein ACXAC7_11585 [Candidatus Hodarchaeales archaeon]|jgi:hypothetical protein